jgi:hypothetical protein
VAPDPLPDLNYRTKQRLTFLKPKVPRTPYAQMSANDPKQTFDSVTECPRQKQTLSANFMKFGIKAFYMGRA